jgi:[acyl-carrier-protein] S-malonyltransferase
MKSSILFSGQNAGIRKHEVEKLLKLDFVKKSYIMFSKLTSIYNSLLDTEPSLKTNNVQPVLYVQMVKSCIQLHEKFPRKEPFKFLMGHSLGEIAALNAANLISAEEGFDLVVKRADLMEAAHLKLKEETKMTAIVLRRSISSLSELPDFIGQIDIASWNMPNHVVLSGFTKDVDHAVNLLKNKRMVLLSKDLPLPYAFHSRHMFDAASAFQQFISDKYESKLKASGKDQSIRILFNKNGRFKEPIDSFSDLLGQQICSTIQWYPSMKMAKDIGVSHWFCCGPSKTSFNWVRKVYPDDEAIHVSCEGED